MQLQPLKQKQSQKNTSNGEKKVASRGWIIETLTEEALSLVIGLESSQLVLECVLKIHKNWNLLLDDNFHISEKIQISLWRNIWENLKAFLIVLQP